MKKLIESTFFVFMFLATVASGCTTAPTPVPSTSTLSPMPPTLTFTPTLAPTPTLTSTPIPLMGTPLSNADWEANLLAAVFRERIVSTGRQYLSTNGYMLIDLVIKVKNLNPSKTASIVASNTTTDKSDTNVITSEASDAIIIDENGKSWIPFLWGDDIAKEGKELDPFSVSIYSFEVPQYSFDPDGSMRVLYTINIENESYLRFIYSISDTSMGKTIGIKFLDLPTIQFSISK